MKRYEHLSIISLSYNGFTLAETLITLVIIGVIAALVVPNAIVNSKKEETVTKLKKAYSTLSQTTLKAIADNGPIDTWEITTLKSKEFSDKYLAPYLSVGKNCGYETTGGCEFKYAYLNDPKSFRTFDNTYNRLILQDGTALIMFAYNVSGSWQGNGQFTLKALYTYIDINGQKGPNVLGKDIFYYVYCINCDTNAMGSYKISGKFIPSAGTALENAGATREKYKTDCSKTGKGQDCSGLIMADGWQIKDDYPW